MTYFVRLKSSGDTGSPAYNGYSEIISMTMPGIKLAAGSHGTAGYAKVTGLTAGKKYVIKADGANWQKVIANGTAADSSVPAATDAGLLIAAQQSVALDAGVTEITGLTDGTTYSVYEVLGAMPVSNLYNLKANADGAGIDLAATSAAASNAALTSGNLLKIAAGASGSAKMYVFDISSNTAGIKNLLKSILSAGKLVAGDTFELDSLGRLVQITKNSTAATADITISNADCAAVNGHLYIQGPADASGMLTVTSLLDDGTPKLLPRGGHITVNNTRNRLLFFADGFSGHITVTAAGGNLTIENNNTAIIKLAPAIADNIKGNITISGGTVTIESDLTLNELHMENGDLFIESALAIAAGKTLTIRLGDQLRVFGMLTGAAGSKVVFNKNAKYQQNNATVHFCDVEADFTTATLSKNVLDADVGPGTNNELRAGEYVWNGTKFVRAETVCFAAGTLVVMADGSLKPIETIAAGDKVKSYDFTSGRELDSAVSKTINRSVSGYFKLNGLKVTGEHPFAFGNGEWKKVKELKIGDRVKGRGADKFVAIYAHEEVIETIEVYNISVEGVKNYFVFDGKSYYLVHNK